LSVIQVRPGDRVYTGRTVTGAYAEYALALGVAEGQASVLVPIAQIGFIIAALLGIFILRERVTIRKVVGLVSALAALAVLAKS
jgi:uncharacterized membrane protein